MASRSKEPSLVWNPGWKAGPEPMLTERDAFAGNWAERNWRNTPGPFYGAATDTCGTGPIVAPTNVFLDPSGQEFIGIQPRDLEEMNSVVSAASHDPLAGYGADGNERWNAELVRDWWSQRVWIVGELTEALRQHAELGRPDESYRRRVESLIHFLEVEAEAYTRRYLYWLENGRSPGEDDRLPTVSR